MTEAERMALFETHERLVYHMTKRYRYDPDYDDIVQAAFMGLWRASQRFEPERNLKFSTLAGTCIINAIREFFRTRMNDDHVKLDPVLFDDLPLPVEDQSMPGSNSSALDLLPSNVDVEVMVCDLVDLGRYRALLTKRQCQMALYRLMGYAGPEIAKKLGVSLKTYRRQIECIKAILSKNKEVVYREA